MFLTFKNVQYLSKQWRNSCIDDILAISISFVKLSRRSIAPCVMTLEVV